MGHVFTRARFRGRGEVEYDEILVDTGATFTVLPIDAAEKLIETPFTVELRLGDGRKVTAKVYVAEAEIEGRRGPVRVVAFEGAIPVIGVDTLETLGLRVDPITGKLEKTEYYMLYV
ncbi:MAG: aspartyl protease family protein [Thermoproteus sp.]